MLVSWKKNYHASQQYKNRNNNADNVVLDIKHYHGDLV